MISYAQNFEDVILRRVFRGKEQGFYIDVGAADPVVESVTKFFYDQGWSGINIEPNEWFYGKLLEQRPRDINLNIALGEREENREMYMFERIGNSTFQASSRDRYVQKGYEAKLGEVRVRTLGDICRDYVRRPIDFLKVDCEGWEGVVLKSGDWDRFRPTVLVVEATEPGTPTPTWQDWEPYLIETARYEMVYFDGLNRFYVPRECGDLRVYFQSPPNVFDEFQTYDSIQAGKARSEAELQIAQFQSQLENTVAENACLANLLKEREIAINEACDLRRTLQLEKQNLAEQVNDLTTRMERDQEQLQGLESRCRELEAERAVLDRNLAETRLWVGQLSQDLAILKIAGGQER